MNPYFTNLAQQSGVGSGREGPRRAEPPLAPSATPDSQNMADAGLFELDQTPSNSGGPALQQVAAPGRSPQAARGADPTAPAVPPAQVPRRPPVTLTNDEWEVGSGPGGATDLAAQGQGTEMGVAPAALDWSVVLDQVRQWVAATPVSNGLSPPSVVEDGYSGPVPAAAMFAPPLDPGFGAPGPVVESRELQLSIGTIQVTLEAQAGPPLPGATPPSRQVAPPVRSRLNRYYLRIR